MNMNLVHNLLNITIAGLGAALLASGCVATANGNFDCSASWLSPTLTSYALLGVGVLKIGMNLYRDGLGGLVKSQPPVDNSKK